MNSVIWMYMCLCLDSVTKRLSKYYSIINKYSVFFYVDPVMLIYLYVDAVIHKSSSLVFPCMVVSITSSAFPMYVLDSVIQRCRNR